MRITWITRSFLDYRIPVYKKINHLCGNKLTVIYYADVVPERCQEKLKVILGERALGLSGELRLTGKKSQPLSSVDGNGIRIPFQPGLIKEIKKSNPEILLSDGFFQWTYATLWLRLWKKIPHLMLYEGTKHTERNVGKIRTLYRKLAGRFIDQIACNGILSKQYIESIGFPSSKISLGNMAADISTLRGKSQKISLEITANFKSQLKIKGSVFLFVGRLVPLKGIDKLLLAWAEIFSKNTEINLLLVGDGPQENELKKYVEDNHLYNVHFTGNVDYDKIHHYFGIADVFIIPTLRDNWSLVVPEAMSCNLPIISSKYNGCWPELVKPENGWVFDPLDLENFESILETAWTNRNKWKVMGNKSLNIVLEYTPEKVTERIFVAINKVLQNDK